MSFKDILLTLSSFPDPTSVTAVDDAVEVAAVIGARISAIVSAIEIRVPASILGNVLLDIPGMAAEAAKIECDECRSASG
jgi:hypothetical protein